VDNSLELQFRRNGRQPSVIGTPERLGELTGYDVGNLGPYCRGAYCWAERSTSQMKKCMKQSGSGTPENFIGLPRQFYELTAGR